MRLLIPTTEFLSNQFPIPKKGDELRPVINLKPLNHFVEYHHFKMEGLSSLLVLINPNDYMITMDLKDASYRSRSMPITRNIYFFEWKSELWEFSCLPFELSSAPQVFTEVMKLVIGKIRSQGIRSVIDLDDMAVLRPCQRIQFLGFTIDSSSMMFSLPQEKLNKLHLLLFI